MLQFRQLLLFLLLPLFFLGCDHPKKKSGSFERAEINKPAVNPDENENPPPPVLTYGLSGNLAGLEYSSLQISLGSETLNLNAPGPFQFSTRLPAGEPYQVTVLQNPASPSISCSLTNASGTIGQNDVTDILISCPQIQSLTFSNLASNQIMGQSVTPKVYALFSDGLNREVTPFGSMTTSSTEKAAFNSGQLHFLDTGSALISFSFANKTVNKNINISNSTLTSLSVNPGFITLASGGSRPVSAYGTYSNGILSDVSSLTSWSSSNPSIFTVANGLILALSAGTASLTAQVGSVSTTITVIVSAATLTEIEVAPALIEMAIGQTTSFIATGVFSDGSFRDLTNEVSWSSSSPLILDHLDELFPHKFTAFSPGAATISASLASLNGSAIINSVGKTIASLSLNGPSQIPNGFKSSFSLIAHYSDGSNTDITDQAIWSSSNETILSSAETLNEKGIFEAISSGSSILTASFGGLQSTITVTTTAATLVSINITPGDLLIAKGMNIDFAALGNFSDGSTVDLTRDVIWSTSNSSLATITSGSESAGRMLNFASGAGWATLNITALYSGISKSIKLTLTPATLTGLQISSTSIQLAPWSSVDLKVYGQFSDGGAVDLTEIAKWSSSATNIALVSNSALTHGRVYGVSVGTSIISAQVGALSDSETINIQSGFASTSTAIGLGLQADYYSGRNFDIFAGRRIDTAINFELSTGTAPLGVGDNYSVRWTGSLKPSESGSYSFYMRSDDGVRVYVDNVLKIDRWTDHAVIEDTFSMNLVSGQSYQIRIEFYENGGHSVCKWEWSGPSFSRQVVGSQYLFQ